MAKSSKRKSGQVVTSEISENKSKKSAKMIRTRKSMPRELPQQRSSIYRGVTRHRWTGRYEAHLWDKNCWNESQNKKGRQVYLGAYDHEETAAHAYDLAALKYWGHETTLNFPVATYENDVKEMEGQSREEYIGSLRRKSSGFSRGVSKYRGVARHHHNGRWEARIGRVFGNKYLYLGTYATQEEAAIAYDMAAIEYRGLNAVTNFDLSRYIKWIKTLSNDTSSATSSDTNGDSSRTAEETITPSIPPPTSSSTIGLLLQSSKFKEMIIEQTAVICSPSVSSEPEPPRRCFPDDIQTSFEFQDSTSFADEHDVMFGNYDSFASAIFPCELDA